MSPAETTILTAEPGSLVPIEHAMILCREAAAVGFDWPDAESVIAKVQEELDEVRDALERGSLDACEDELGDLLFSSLNLARKLNLDPTRALARTNAKFIARFQHMERAVACAGRGLNDCGSDELERLWSLASDALRDGE